MNLNDYTQLIFLCVVNIFFTCCGIFFNSLVILSFIKSSQLRKKLCYFMIMILSCVDLLAVATNHPMVMIFSIAWLTEKYDSLHTLTHALRIVNMFLGFSLLTLFVMSIDRYLAIAYPLFHRVSVTKHRLLTLLALLFLFQMILAILQFANEFIVAYPVGSLIVFAIISPPFFFVNIKMLMIVRRERRNKAEPRKASTIVKLKNISTCLLAVASFVLFSIPVCTFIAIRFVEKRTSTTTERLFGLWIATAVSMNSTFNCLIFYWRNKILRKEGMKILKLLQYQRCLAATS